MTPSLIKTETLSIAIKDDAKVERAADGYGVMIDLGYTYKLYGNRREDFEALAVLAGRAVAFFS